MSIGKSPNGLNQISASKIELFVSGSSVVGFTSESVNIVGKVSASAVQTYEIGTPQSQTLDIKSNTKITGSLNVSSSLNAASAFISGTVSASFFKNSCTSGFEGHNHL